MKQTQDVREFIPVSEVANRLGIDRSSVYRQHKEALVNINPNPKKRPTYRLPRWYVDALLAKAAPPKEVSA